MEFNIMSADKAREVSEASRERRIQEDVQRMIEDVETAICNGRQSAYLHDYDYEEAALDILLPILKDKGYKVVNCVDYVEVCW